MGNIGINTYSQIHLQFIFAVKYRRELIDKLWNENLHKYITGIIQKKTHKMLAINTMPDHLHVFIGFRPDNNISDLVQTVKIESTNFINDNNFTNRKFE